MEPGRRAAAKTLSLKVQCLVRTKDVLVRGGVLGQSVKTITADCCVGAAAALQGDLCRSTLEQHRALRLKDADPELRPGLSGS